MVLRAPPLLSDHHPALSSQQQLGRAAHLLEKPSPRFARRPHEPATHPATPLYLPATNFLLMLAATAPQSRHRPCDCWARQRTILHRSEEHTSELQSQSNL